MRFKHNSVWCGIGIHSIILIETFPLIHVLDIPSPRWLEWAWRCTTSHAYDQQQQVSVCSWSIFRQLNKWLHLELCCTLEDVPSSVRPTTDADYYWHLLSTRHEPPSWQLYWQFAVALQESWGRVKCGKPPFFLVWHTAKASCGVQDASQREQKGHGIKVDDKGSGAQSG